jgi:hypothetical protein
MKTILLSLTCFCGSLIFAAGFFDVTSDINTGIKNGNAAAIANYFVSSVELNLPGNEGLYSKAQAEMILRDFFSKNPPKNFTPKHEGFSNDGSKYYIGSLESTTGVFRTYFFVKKSGDLFQIKEFRIERER